MKLSSQNRTALDFILWTLLAILLGLILSFSFLPFFGVMPWAAIQIMFSEVFANGYSAGNVLVKTTPMILTGLAFAFIRQNCSTSAFRVNFTLAVLRQRQSL